MNHGVLKPILVAMALLCTGPAWSQDTKKKAAPPAAPAPSATDLNPLIAAQSKARSKALKAEKKKQKTIPEAQRVDINSATKEELIKLPGVSEAYAAKIIAGRPYLTKIHLVTHDVLPYAVYTSIKGRIIARQKGVK